MTGFSTITSGTIVSPTRQNYDVSISANSTVSAVYSTAGIPDKVGLQVVISNTSTSTITLTASVSGEFDNYLTYPNYCTAINQVQVPAKQSVTLITTVVGTNYTISAISAMVNINAGAAGDLIYQSSPSHTAFLAAGTPNYILVGSGAALPPQWQLLSTGNLSGGVAGSLVYQSAPDTTSKSAVGTTFSYPGGGSIATTTSTGVVGWQNYAFKSAATDGSLSAGVLTLNSPRAYTFSASSLGGSSGNLYTYMNSISLPQYDGDVYTFFNDTGSNYVLTIQNIQNPNSWSKALITSFTGGANQVTIYPEETITFQRYNPTFLSILSATQSQGWIGAYQAQQPGTSQTVLNYSAVSDPQGWLQSNTQRIQPNVAGYYMVYVNWSMANNNITIPVTINKNGIIYTQSLQGPNTGQSQSTMCCAVIPMNGTTDYLTVTINFITSAQWTSGTATNLTVMLLQ